MFRKQTTWPKRGGSVRVGWCMENKTFQKRYFVHYLGIRWAFVTLSNVSQPKQISTCCFFISAVSWSGIFIAIHLQLSCPEDLQDQDLQDCLGFWPKYTSIRNFNHWNIYRRLVRRFRFRRVAPGFYIKVRIYHNLDHHMRSPNKKHMHHRQMNLTTPSRPVVGVHCARSMNGNRSVPSFGERGVPAGRHGASCRG